MQSASVTSLQSYCHCIVSNPFRQPGRKSRSPTSVTLPNYQTHLGHVCSFVLLATNNLSKQRHTNQNIAHPNRIPPAFQHHFRFSSDSNTSNNQTPEIQPQGGQLRTESSATRVCEPSASMWWPDLKAALGQRINIEGIVSSVTVFAKDRHLALPHVAVPDIRHVDWAELHRRGFKGVVFDKDNTLTAPYSLTLWDPLGSSIERCKSVFGHNIAVFSNSAGVKKPAGVAEEIEQHFGCESSQLIMVGDRPFTDIVYGNRNGFLTILTAPLSLAGEPFVVRQVRCVEVAIVKHWFERGLTPIGHKLISDPQLCAKDPSSP
ncbi:phosphatidylglycerophosphate phosphatase 1, chloroplastic isoform X2 [Tripterygium wilfordii]|uniref:phosphatidylglycerophosphate phosphatase 1, chloroplastic isoform X2 n=1 Tax=Tripterygium wilfordii TaxID=458696 RepID=UPI0018F7FF83|nr:phosphatidylglycerophosphate phosphatase 1, chloroplastic isoform X2 [Tripterygium wilfordii]